jgi:hypothetical protein|tara:strand:+ start:2518 stop:2910 length:393 start_codon:yes stop_codon:yes gene_type:complete
MKSDDKAFKMMKDVYDNDNVNISKSYYLGDSNIHGTGAFASRNIESKENIGTALKTKGNVRDLREGVDYVRTELGKKVNHQFDNNSYLKKEGRDYNLYSAKKINKGSEITANYKNTPRFIDSNTKGYKEL